MAAIAALKYADAQDMEQKARRLRREIYGDYADDPRCLMFEVQELARIRDRSEGPCDSLDSVLIDNVIY